MAEQKREAREERELRESNRSDGAGTPIYLTSDSTLQSLEEHAHDKQVDPRKDTSVEVSRDDLHDAKAGRMTGRDESNDNQS